MEKKNEPIYLKYIEKYMDDKIKPHVRTKLKDLWDKYEHLEIIDKLGNSFSYTLEDNSIYDESLNEVDITQDNIISDFTNKICQREFLLMGGKGVVDLIRDIFLEDFFKNKIDVNKLQEQ